MHGRYSSPRYSLWISVGIFLVTTFTTLTFSLVLGYCVKAKLAHLETHSLLISEITSVRIWNQKGDVVFRAPYQAVSTTLNVTHKASSKSFLESIPKSVLSIDGSEVTVLVRKPERENKLTSCYFSEAALETPLKRIEEFSVTTEHGSVDLYQPLYPVSNLQVYATTGANVSVDQLAWNGSLTICLNGSYNEALEVRASIGVERRSRIWNGCKMNVTAPAGSILLNLFNMAGRFDIHTLKGKVDVVGNFTLTLNEPNHKIGFTTPNGTSFLYSSLGKGDISVYLARQFLVLVPLLKMVRAFYLDQPEKDISLEEVAKLGVLHFVFDADNYEQEGKLAKVREERGYNYSDQVNSTKIPELDKKLVIFFEEHLHTDEEIRFFLDGRFAFFVLVVKQHSGYFDVRDGRTPEDRWFFALTPQPAGIYHRFAVDDTKFFHVMRLFQGEPVWTPHNRALKETEKMRAREEYITKFLTARS